MMPVDRRRPIQFAPARQRALRRVRLLSAAPALLLAGLGFLLPTMSEAAEKLQKLRVSMPVREGALFAPFNIALDKGFYKEEGIDLDVMIAGGGVSTSAQLAGDVDINTSGPAAIVPIMRGARLKLVFTLATHSTDEIWSTSRDIKSLRDLKGKPVGVVTRGDTNEIGVRMALLKSGLPSDWVTYTALGQLSNVLAALKVSSLPAVVLGGISVEQARDAGFLSNGHLLYDGLHNLEMPYNSIAVTDKFLSENRELLHRFLRATLKGVRYMKQHKADTLAIMRKYSTSNPRILEADYDRLVPVLSLDGTVPDASLLSDINVRASIIGVPAAKIPPLGRFYDFSIVRAVNAQLDAARWTP